jgi:hypothetical protein
MKNRLSSKLVTSLKDCTHTQPHGRMICYLLTLNCNTGDLANRIFRHHLDTISDLHVIIQIDFAE